MAPGVRLRRSAVLLVALLLGCDGPGIVGLTTARLGRVGAPSASTGVIGEPLPAERIVRIVMHGVSGKITVHGRTYDMEMPPLKGFTDEQVAAILTYARREWEHAGDPIDAATVKRIREETKNREAGWTEKELLEIK